MAKKKTIIVSWLEKYKRLLVFAFAFLLYANTIPNEYNLDDELVTTTDPQTPHRLTSKGIAAIPEIFTEPYYKDASGYAYDYRPLVLTTFAIEHSVFGDNVHISHFINALLYALLCLVMLTALSVLFKEYNPLLPLLATLIFAVHPIHAEAVASIKNRDEILALLFGMFALLFALRAANAKNWRLVFAALLFYFFALLSKQNSIYFAAIIPLVLIVSANAMLAMPLVFSVVAALLYIPVSNFIVVKYSLAFVSIFPVFVLLIYAIKNLTPEQIVAFPRQLFSMQAAPVIANEQTDIEKTNYSPVIIGNKLLVLVISVIAAVSAYLFAHDNLYWILPLSFMYILPFMTRGKIQTGLFLLLFVMSLSLCFFFHKSVDFFGVFSVYFNVILLYKKETWYKIFPVALIMLNIALFHFAVYVDILITVACFGWLFTRYKTIFKTILFAIGAIGFIMLIPDPSKPYFAWSERLPSVCFSFLPLYTTKFKRFLWIPVCAFIVVFISVRPPVQPAISSTDALGMLNQQQPVIIPHNNIDRPINFIETVTGLHSEIEYKLGTTAQVFLKYLKLVILPYPQSFYYGYKIIQKESVFTALNLLTFFVYGIFFFIAVFTARKNQIISLGIFIYLISILVYSGLLVPLPGMMADRFLFVPSLGFSILAGYGLIILSKIDIKNKSYMLSWEKFPASLKYAALGLLCVYSILTIVRNSQWKNHLTLFGADIDHLSESVQANNLYAMHLMKYSFQEENKDNQKLMREKAEGYFKRALELYPEFANAQFDLARTQAILGKNEDAEKSFYKAALLNPKYPSTWLGAAEIAMADKRLSDAKKYYAEGMKYTPNEPTFYLQLSWVYYNEKNFDSANIVNERAVELFPTNPDFPTNTAKTFWVMNEKDSALYYFNKALVLSPNNQQIINDIRQLSGK